MFFYPPPSNIVVDACFERFVQICYFIPPHRRILPFRNGNGFYGMQGISEGNNIREYHIITCRVLSLLLSITHNARFAMDG